jgi:hypothetical protein
MVMASFSSFFLSMIGEAGSFKNQLGQKMEGVGLILEFTQRKFQYPLHMGLARSLQNLCRTTDRFYVLYLNQFQILQVNYE